MKKCSMYLDFVNSDNYDENDKEAMKDIIAHSLHCTDCSYDRRIREQMLLELSSYPEPEYPENLHEISLSSAFDKDSVIEEKVDYIGRFFNGLLRPMEFAIPLACVVMLCFMIDLNKGQEPSGFNTDQYASESMNKIKVAESNENINDSGLQKVSSEEVKEFLAKLDEFQKLHPESKSMKGHFMPDVRLVVDK